MNRIFKKQQVREEEFSLDVFRIISFKSGYHFKMHSHKRVELNFIQAGSCIMMLDNKLVKLSQDSLILIFPGTKHDFFVDSRMGIRLVQLEFQLDEPFLREFKDIFDSEVLLPNVSTNFIKIVNNKDIGDCMKRIIGEKKLELPNYQILSKLYFKELGILISRYVSNFQTSMAELENVHLRKSIEIIHTDYGTKVLVSDLAQACNISERYLRKLFTNYLDTSPQGYLNKLRIMKAVELMLDFNTPIKEIAYAVGYSTPQYFSRAFKENYGLSPHKYRKILFESQRGL